MNSLFWAVGKNAIKLGSVRLIQILAFFCLSVNLEQFFYKFWGLDIYFANSDFAAYFKQLHDVAGIALDRLNAHVIVHTFFHEGGLGEALALLGYIHRVELVKLGQVKKHVGLVVAKTADWIFTIVGVKEAAAGQVG
jgi:hypothetical protein